MRSATHVLAAFLVIYVGFGGSHLMGVTCDLPKPHLSKVLAASNCIYEVVMNDGASGGYGAYTAATGPLHPVTIAMGGRQTVSVGRGYLLTPFFNSVSIRSWESHTDYLFDAVHDTLMEDGGFTCVAVRDLPRLQITKVFRDDGQMVGLSAFFNVEERGDRLGITVRIEARGEGFEDSAVEITTTVENLGQEDSRIGIRYLWVPGILKSALVALGLVPPDPPEEPWVTRELAWLEPSFDRFFFSWTDTPSLDDPYYFSGASVNGPWPLDPAATPPDRIITSFDVRSSIPEEKAGPANVCFDWQVPDPPRGPLHSGGIEAMAYYWGDTEGKALALPPGGSTSVTVWVWAFLENPVTCDAGGPYPQTECTGPRTPLALAGSGSYTDEGNPLLYRWSSSNPDVAFDDPEAESPTAFLPGPGTHPISLDVGIGPYTRACDAEPEVVDTTPPDLRVPVPLVLRTSAFGPKACELPATLVAKAEDRCWPEVTVTHTTDPYLGAGGEKASYLFPPGTTRIIFAAEDPSGNIATAETTVTVIDDTPPEFTFLEAEPSLLWPPNHKMADITVKAEAWDNCDDSPRITLLDAASSEPDDDRGDGHTSGDIQGTKPGTADFRLRLRAERDGRGPGRTYTLRYLAEDEWDNQTIGETLVIVPHDMGRTDGPQPPAR